ncbi:MAG TPA: TonB family protein [Steroidobacteraceae bacterium]|nr:TonB family protein [Steroidobacteraceae bacterium]
MTEVWTKWEGQVINGVFPLRRLLSASDHSAVFLTEYKAQSLPDAALKLVPAIPALAQAQLSHWTTAATFAHPHLIRLFEAGRCQLGGLQFLFVVMEYAEQTLSQILAQRALTSGEVREMLPPTLSALAFLHSKNLVHGRLKPSNILAVNDQLRLASDTVRPAGESTANIARSSVYDPPEAKHHSFSSAGDIWGLGITMVEALTQHLPSWPDSNSETASFPAALPPTFVAIVRQCLNRNPASRPTVADVEAQINPAPQMPVVSEPRPPLSAARPLVSAPQPLVSIAKPRVREVPNRATPLEESPKQRSFLQAIAVLAIVVVAAWVGLHVLGSRTSLHQVAPPTAASQNPETSLSAPPGASAPSQPTQPLANRLPSVLHEEIPVVPRRNRDTIRGHIMVAVRVTVDSSGNVVDETLENPGPSKYFARLATKAARKWKFSPAGNHDSRKWLLQFEFTRGGATGHATTPRS